MNSLHQRKKITLIFIGSCMVAGGSTMWLGPAFGSFALGVVFVVHGLSMEDRR